MPANRVADDGEKMIAFPARVPPRVVAGLRRYAHAKTLPSDPPMPIGVALDRLLEQAKFYEKYPENGA